MVYTRLPPSHVGAVSDLPKPSRRLVAEAAEFPWAELTPGVSVWQKTREFFCRYWHEKEENKTGKISEIYRTIDWNSQVGNVWRGWPNKLSQSFAAQKRNWLKMVKPQVWHTYGIWVGACVYFILSANLMLAWYIDWYRTSVTCHGDERLLGCMVEVGRASCFMSCSTKFDKKVGCPCRKSFMRRCMDRLVNHSNRLP